MRQSKIIRRVGWGGSDRARRKMGRLYGPNRWSTLRSAESLATGTGRCRLRGRRDSGENGPQIVQAHRLGEEVGHAGVLAALTVFGECVGR